MGLEGSQETFFELNEKNRGKIISLLLDPSYRDNFISGAKLGMITNHSRVDSFASLIDFLEHDILKVERIELGIDDSIIFYGTGDRVLYEGKVTDFRGDNTPKTVYCTSEFHRLVTLTKKKPKSLDERIEKILKTIRDIIGL